MITGPVVGLVTQTSAKLLLEVSLPGEVALNVFLLSGMATEGRFISKQVTLPPRHDPKLL